MRLSLLTHPRNVLLPLAAVMFILGWWQLQRMSEKQVLLDEFANASAQSLDKSLSGEARFARVESTGRFVTAKHILLDNMVFNGRAGVHVFTPFQTFSGTTVLVNRGWLPIAPDRASLPEFHTPVVPLAINGILAPPPEHRQKLGAADELKTDQWPQLVTYLELETVASALQTKLADKVLWLDADDPAGFEDRDWSPSTMSPQHHQAYAVQWLALGFAALGFWAVLLWREIRKP